MDPKKLVIVVDPGVINVNDLLGSPRLVGATVIRYRKTVWGLSSNYRLGPLSFFYLDEITPRTKEEIIKVLEDVPLESVPNIVSGNVES